jgi:hypothetical protein
VKQRIAPEPARQFSSVWTLMRNEYTSLPYLAELAPGAAVAAAAVQAATPMPASWRRVACSPAPAAGISPGMAVAEPARLWCRAGCHPFTVSSARRVRIGWAMAEPRPRSG